MDTLKRLLRRPASTIVWAALLTLAALILGVAGSLYASALGIPAALEKRQTTIAVQNNRMEEQEDGSWSFDPESVLLYQEDIDYLLSLPQVKGIDLRRFSGAYIEGLCARIGLENFFNNYQNIWQVNDSYKNVLILGTVEKVWTADYDSIVLNDLTEIGHGDRVGEKWCCALMNVDEVVSMHPDYPLFPQGPDDELYTGKVRIRFNVFDEQEGPFFKVGSKYAVYGEYSPLCSSMNNDPMPPEVPMAPHVFYSPTTLGYFSCFVEGDELVSYKSEYEEVTTEDIPTIDDPGTMKLKTLENRTPVVKEWDGTAAELLEDPYWGGLAEELEMDLHAFPVIGTNCLESMYGFLENKVKIVEGRMFTEEEYKNGSRVLVLDESIARAGGLSVGDTVLVRQFEPPVGDEQGNSSIRTTYSDFQDSTNNPGLGRDPFFVEPPREAEEFTIVGLYRQENKWDDSLGSFTPNTIFVPRGAQIDEAVGGPSELLGYEERTSMGYHVDENGSIVEKQYTWQEPIIDPGLVNGMYMSILLKNGSIGEFLERIDADSEYTEIDYPMTPEKTYRVYTKGLGGHKFLCFDQGFDDAKGSIGAITDSGRKLALIAGGGAVLIFIAYMLLYQSFERRNLGVMRSLGANKPEVRRYLFTSGLIIAVIGVFLGTALSGVVSKLVSDKLAELTVSNAKLTDSADLFREMLTEGGMPAWSLAALGLAEAAAGAAALWAQAAHIAGKKTRKLLGK